jgi:PAS domain S-box-containing protein
MKPDIKPRNHELSLRDNEFIVSKTDTKGRITYANRVFMQIAGYNERQLINVQHNIVRHPDMPRGAFRLLWQTLEKGQEFFGFVKNMSADGSFYWVFANVTPDYDQRHQLQGYFSVRRCPRRSAIEAIIPIYQQMLQIEREAGARDGPDRSIAFLLEKLQGLNTDYESLVLKLQGGAS